MKCGKLNLVSVSFLGIICASFTQAKVSHVLIASKKVIFSLGAKRILSFGRPGGIHVSSSAGDPFRRDLNYLLPSNVFLIFASEGETWFPKKTPTVSTDNLRKTHAWDSCQAWHRTWKYQVYEIQEIIFRTMWLPKAWKGSWSFPALNHSTRFPLQLACTPSSLCRYYLTIQGILIPISIT